MLGRPAGNTANEAGVARVACAVVGVAPFEAPAQVGVYEAKRPAPRVGGPPAPPRAQPPQGGFYEAKRPATRVGGLQDARRAQPPRVPGRGRRRRAADRAGSLSRDE